MRCDFDVRFEELNELTTSETALFVSHTYVAIYNHFGKFTE